MLAHAALDDLGDVLERGAELLLLVVAQPDRVRDLRLVRVRVRIRVRVRLRESWYGHSHGDGRSACCRGRGVRRDGRLGAPRLGASPAVALG